MPDLNYLPQTQRFGIHLPLLQRNCSAVQLTIADNDDDED